MIDLDLRGDTEDIERRLAKRAEQEAKDKPKQGPGRPRLGVVPREVTLVAAPVGVAGAQPGGASAALRRLVDQTRKADRGETEARAGREAAFRFISAIAGDLPSFEEAIQALFAGDRERFDDCVAQWPEDVRTFALRLAFPGTRNRPLTGGV